MEPSDKIHEIVIDRMERNSYVSSEKPLKPAPALDKFFLKYVNSLSISSPNFAQRIG
jgi:hypothetical protein